MGWTRPVAVLVAKLALVGCASQATSNAVDMNASYRSLLTKQILYNLGQASEDPAFFPSQIVVNAGSTDSVGTITPTVTLPLPATTVVSTVAQAAASTVTNTSSTALGNLGFTLAASAQSKFTWGITVKNDPDELRRLRTLYLFAVGQMPASCPGPRGINTREAWDACFKLMYVMQGSPRNVNQVFTDRPSCVLCGSAANQNDLKINERLTPGFIRTSPLTGDRLLAAHDGKRFYVAAVGGEEAFVEFVFFVLEAISNSATFVQYTPPPPTAAETGTRAPAPPPVIPRSQGSGKIQAPPPIFVQPL